VNWLGWLKPIDIERLSVRKLLMVCGFLLIGCVLFAAYEIWSKPNSCVIRDIHADKGSAVAITCNGNVHKPDQRMAPIEAPEIAAQTEMKAGIPELARRMRDQKPIYEPLLTEDRKPRVVIVEVVRKRIPGPFKNSIKTGRKAVRKDNDPFPLRTFKVIPMEDISSAFAPSKSILGSCTRRYMPCYMPRGFGREIPVRIPNQEFDLLNRGLSGGGSK
jgi:hypothetical protein